MSIKIDRRLHGGRSLRGYEGADGDEVAGWPEVAYEAIRGINHLTLYGGPIPAPTVYDVLGNLKGVAHMLPQALGQLGDGLVRSLEAFDVYDSSGPPQDSVDQASAHLVEARDLAQQLGAALERAQSAIATQGYNEPGGE